MSDSNLWVQVAAKLKHIVTRAYADSLYLAGKFGTSRGGDLDLFLVFLPDQDDAVRSFFNKVKADLLESFKDKINKTILPFRYALHKPFLCGGGGVDCVGKASPTLPVHFLMFPDREALISWEDHEIIRQVLKDIQRSDNLWIGTLAKIHEVQRLLKSRDFHSRRRQYEELLFGAYQDISLALAPAAKERAREQAAYAVRYLVVDEATRRYGTFGTDRNDVIDYMLKHQRPGVELVTGDLPEEGTLVNVVEQAFRYWHGQRGLVQHPAVKVPAKFEGLEPDIKACSTPTLLIDEHVVHNNFRKLRDAFALFPSPVEISYAIKANPMPPLLQAISNLSFGGMCATSYSDLAALRRVKINPALVYVHLLCPTADVLSEVFRRGYNFVLCDLSTIDVIRDVLRDLDGSLTRPPRILLRLRPQCANRRGYYRFGLLSSGVDSHHNELEAGIRHLKELPVHVVGLAMHSHACSTDPTLWSEALSPIARATKQEWSSSFSTAPIVNIGGGFASSETLSDYRVKIADFAEAALEVLHECDFSTLVIEPGRYIVADAGIVVAAVRGNQHAAADETTDYLVIDAGSNLLIPLDSADFRFSLLPGDETHGDVLDEAVTVSDSFSSFGLLGNGVTFDRKPQCGDRVVVGNSGAYTLSMASSGGDGMPSYRFISERSERFRSPPSRHFVQDASYLETKIFLDRPLLEPIFARIDDLIVSRNSLRVLDVGCGTGAYLEHMLNSSLRTRQLFYLGVDTSAELIKTARETWLNKGLVRGSVDFVTGAAHELRDVVKERDWDLVAGLSLMEYVPQPDVLQQLAELVARGGLLHLPINYDGETQFEPTFDRELEERVIAEFNRQLIPDPYAGRRLFHNIVNLNLQIRDYSVADWMILPNRLTDAGYGYHTLEERFLEYLLNAIERLQTGTLLSRDELKNWVCLRRDQLKRRELMFICRQCSILAQR